MSKFATFVHGFGDLRAWVTLGLFGLSWRVLELMAAKPDLTHNTLFISYSTAMGVTNLGVAVNYFLSSSKGASEANARADVLASKISPAP